MESGISRPKKINYIVIIYSILFFGGKQLDLQIKYQYNE